jgi:hypothetical protein
LERIIDKPLLRADSLAITKTDEPDKPASKSKATGDTTEKPVAEETQS